MLKDYLIRRSARSSLGKLAFLAAPVQSTWLAASTP
jgi:hypothetical protein